MNKYILGISCFYHDSAAALIEEGNILVAVQEERFTRKKHDSSFPINAIRYCLESQNINLKIESDYKFETEKEVIEMDSLFQGYEQKDSLQLLEINLLKTQIINYKTLHTQDSSPLLLFFYSR